MALVLDLSLYTYHFTRDRIEVLESNRILLLHLLDHPCANSTLAPSPGNLYLLEAEMRVTETGRSGSFLCGVE